MQIFYPYPHWLQRKCNNDKKFKIYQQGLDLLTNQKQVWACTTRPPGEHSRQVSKKIDQWFWKRCKNDVVAVFTIVQIIFHFLWDHWAHCVNLKMEFCLCIC